MKIESRYIETKLVKWREIKDFQIKDFKSMSKAAARRYIHSVDELNLIRNFKVFMFEGEIYHIDGHHLAKILKVGEEEDRFENIETPLPDLLLADFYRIEDRETAVKIILAHSSTYARITYEGLDEFATINEVAIEELKKISEIPAITWAYWDDPEPPSTEKTDAEGSLESLLKGSTRYKIKKPKISFPVESHEYAILLSALKRIKARRELPDMASVLKHLISYEEEIELDNSQSL